LLMFVWVVWISAQFLPLRGLSLDSSPEDYFQTGSLPEVLTLEMFSTHECSSLQ
jgi:hypothetical protein